MLRSEPQSGNRAGENLASGLLGVEERAVGHRQTRSFSLIELLIVISIIAVLLSLLLPALSKSREFARKSACASNLRGLGQAVSLYTNDYSSWLPQYSNPWTEQLLPYLYPNIEPHENVYSNVALLTRRKNAMSTFQCPSNEKTSLIWRSGGGVYGNGGPTNYQFQVRCGLFTSGDYGPVTIVKVTKPSCAVITVDARNERGSLVNSETEVFYDFTQFGFIHNLNCCALCLDYHIEQFSPSQMPGDLYYWQWARDAGQ